MQRFVVSYMYLYVYSQGRHSPQIGAENQSHSQWQKVMYFPNFMLKNFQLHLQETVFQSNSNIKTFQRERTLIF